MISFPQALAEAYVSPSRNVALPSTPGRQVKFLQGHSTIKDGRDMVAMLRDARVKLVVTPYALSWMPEWLKQVPQVKAQVIMPEIEYFPDDAESSA